MTRDVQAADRGLQAERTVLAWTRTSIAAIASGVLVVLKDHHGVDPVTHTGQLAIGALASLVAAAFFMLGARRRRTLMRRPLPARLTPQSAVFAAGASVMALAALIVGYLLLPLVSQAH